MKAHWVYRAYDKAGRLLYVGATNDLAARMTAHAANSDWYAFMAAVESVQYDSKSPATEAESAAIFDEFPRWNTVGRNPAHPDGYMLRNERGAWLETEREIARQIRRLRQERSDIRARFERLSVELRMQEALAAAVSDGSLDMTPEKLVSA